MNWARLLERYNQPAPRYTSYPPAPHWQAAGPDLLISALGRSSKELSLYVHVPFCEKACLYCGCNTVISNNHDVAEAYLDSVIREMDLMKAAHGRTVTQIHWGGGTPTYLTSAQIRRLFQAMRTRFEIAPEAEVSIEVDPRVTTPDQLQTLRSLGFNRLSIGIQDFDPAVQKAIGRIQPFDVTRRVFDAARNAGFDSINVDLVYGLPAQTICSMARTLDLVIQLNPDRISAFGYAHVPSMKPRQRVFEKMLPSEQEKLNLFLFAIDRLTTASYRYIGIDHFARFADPLAVAHANGTLHRNFQGYTVSGDTDLIGFGPSAISNVAGTYTQNERDLIPYEKSVQAGVLPVTRGYIRTNDDRIRGGVIEMLLCSGMLNKDTIEQHFGLVFDEFFAAELKALQKPEQDGLVRGLASRRVELTPQGRIFARVIARAFDAFHMAAVSSKAI